MQGVHTKTRLLGSGSVGERTVCFRSPNGGGSMNEIDNTLFGVDGLMPRIGSVRAIDSENVLIKWAEGARAGRKEAVNLLPLIDNFKLYHPLRRNKTLFST